MSDITDPNVIPAFPGCPDGQILDAECADAAYKQWQKESGQAYGACVDAINAAGDAYAAREAHLDESTCPDGVDPARWRTRMVRARVMSARTYRDDVHGAEDECAIEYSEANEAYLAAMAKCCHAPN